MELPKNCATCAHYDGDHYCAHPSMLLLVMGYIPKPALVVCANHQDKEPDADLSR